MRSLRDQIKDECVVGTMVNALRLMQVDVLRLLSGNLTSMKQLNTTTSTEIPMFCHWPVSGAWSEPILVQESDLFVESLVI